DALGLQVFADHFLPALASNAAALVTAERRHVAHRAVGVHPYRAGLQLLGHAERPAHALRPDARRKPENHVVADRDRLVLVLERDHRQYRPEYFLLRDPHAVVNPGEDGGLDEPAFAAFGPRRLAASEHRLG